MVAVPDALGGERATSLMEYLVPYVTFERNALEEYIVTLGSFHMSIKVCQGSEVVIEKLHSGKRLLS